MKDSFLWREKIPPVDTFVWVKYSETDSKENWQIVKTCKRGCCVSTSFGNMILPTLWCLTTQQEAEQEQKNWDTLSTINVEDLY